jgi:DNA-binding transcriptional LysR family regulator
MANSFVHVHIMALRYFAETVRAGSMRQAADFMSTAPSAVNRQILKLEDQLQVKLFDRVADGVRLTAAGEVLYGYIRNLERDLDRAIDQIDNMRALRRGHVRIAVEDGIARDFLTDEITAFAAKHPGVTFSVEIQGASTVMERVAHGEAELGLSMNPPSRTDVRKVISIPIPSGVVMRPDHPLAGAAQLTLGEIASERMILGAHGYGGGEHVNREITEGSRHRPFIETNSSDATQGFVLAGLGLTIRSPVGILGPLQRGELCLVPLVGRGAPSVSLCLWTHPNRSPSIASSVLTQQLAQSLERFSERLAPWCVPVADPAT